MRPDPSIRQTWLIAYDVRQPARLRRVHKFLSNLGHALQYSVFAADMNISELKLAKMELEKRADARVDDVRLYCLSSRMRGNWIGPMPRDAGVAIHGSPAGTLVRRLVENPLDASGTARAKHE